MNVFYLLGRLTRKFIDLKNKINPKVRFILLFGFVYFVVTDINVYPEDWDNLVLGLWYLGIFAGTIGFYYMVFLIFRNSLRWVGKQLTYHQNEKK